MLRKYLVLWLILLLALLVRTYQISKVPLYGDELTMVYDTYSILKTGRDSSGEILPLTFRMGAGRPAGYVYFSLPFVLLFGPSAIGVRLLSVLSGVGIVFVVYLLAEKMFSKKVGLFSAFLVSISPLAISLSRAGFESNFATFLATLGIYFLLEAKKRKYLYFLWALCWGIVIHTYPTFKLTLPVLSIVIFAYLSNLKSLIKNKFFIISMLFLSIFVAASINETIKGRSEARFLSINIFADTNITERILEHINYERSVSALPDVVKKYFYNRPIEYGRYFIENYFKNFSPEYFLNRGDGNPRHNPAEVGIIYLIETLTILVGIVYGLVIKRKVTMLLLLWILTVPLSTTLVGEPHNLRNAFMLIPLVILSGFGFSLMSKKVKVLVFVLILFQFLFVLQRIYFLAPQKFANFWAESAKIASDIAIQKSKEYKNIIISDKIDNVEYAYPVYAKLNPNLVIDENNKRTAISGIEFKRYQNILIGRVTPEFLAKEQSFLKDTLYIGNVTESGSFENYKTITASDLTGGIILKDFN